MANEPEEEAKSKYLEAYRLFNECEYGRALEFARNCLEIVSSGSYWYSGSLGLCCWAANFVGDHGDVEKYARMLLKENAGSEKPWFDGLAYFNLGLAYKSLGDKERSRDNFRKAHERYSCYQVPSGVPESWKYVNQFFLAVSSFTATGETELIESLKARLSDKKQALPDDSEIFDLMKSLDLYIAYAGKDDVARKALAAIKEGVSPTFLAHLVL